MRALGCFDIILCLRGNGINLVSLGHFCRFFQFAMLKKPVIPTLFGSLQSRFPLLPLDIGQMTSSIYGGVFCFSGSKCSGIIPFICIYQSCFGQTWVTALGGPEARGASRESANQLYGIHHYDIRQPLRNHCRYRRTRPHRSREVP